MLEELAPDLAEKRQHKRIFRSAAERAQQSVELHGEGSGSSRRIRRMGSS